MALRPLTESDAPLLVEATGRALWGHHPVGPYTLADAREALRAWDRDTATSPAVAGEHRIGDGGRARGYAYEGLLPQHCREWTHEGPAQDSRHDCLIWGHRSPVAQ